MYSIAKNDKGIAIVCDNVEEAFQILGNLSHEGPHYFKDGEDVLTISNVKNILMTMQVKGEFKDVETGEMFHELELNYSQAGRVKR